MILCAPRGMLALQKPQQLAALNFLAGCLQQERAAAARPYQLVDLPQQISGNQNVRPMCACHMCIRSVTCAWKTVKHPRKAGIRSVRSVLALQDRARAPARPDSPQGSAAL